MKNYNEVYKELNNVVLGYLIKKTRDKELAEDLTSDTLYKVFVNIDKFDEDKANIKTWAVNIANNVLIDHWRKRKLATSSIHDFVDDEGNETIQYSDNTTPFSEMVNKQIGLGIDLAFSKLPTNYQDIANLYFKKQLSYEEISVELDKPLGTIKANIFRVRKMLQEKLTLD